MLASNFDNYIIKKIILPTCLKARNVNIFKSIKTWHGLHFHRVPTMSDIPCKSLRPYFRNFIFRCSFEIRDKGFRRRPHRKLHLVRRFVE